MTNQEIIDKCAELAKEYYNSATLQKYWAIEEYIRYELWMMLKNKV